MKFFKIVFVFLFLVGSTQVWSQAIKKFENSTVVELLNNATLLSDNSDAYLSVKVFKIANEPGSAGFPTGEVTHNLLIAVSEHDETPMQSLFEAGPFLNPEFVSWTSSNGYKKTFEIKSGVHSKRRKKKIKVDINNIEIIE